MAQVTRKEARRILFELVFEREFRSDENSEEIYDLACEVRDLPENKYIKDGFFGVCENIELIDAVIGNYAHKWRTDRLSKASKTAIRLAVYEILFVDDIPESVSINEAVELIKTFGEEKARAFINGVLAGIVRDIKANGKESLINKAKSQISKTDEITEDKTGQTADNE